MSFSWCGGGWKKPNTCSGGVSCERRTWYCDNVQWNTCSSHTSSRDSQVPSLLCTSKALSSQTSLCQKHWVDYIMLLKTDLLYPPPIKKYIPAKRADKTLIYEPKLLQSVLLKSLQFHSFGSLKPWTPSGMKVESVSAVANSERQRQTDDVIFRLTFLRWSGPFKQTFTLSFFPEFGVPCSNKKTNQGPPASRSTNRTGEVGPPVLRIWF